MANILSRRVRAEILDSMPPDDPSAQRSRGDLRRINALMGNYRWIERQVGERVEWQSGRLVELGAGDGRLSLRLAKRFPGLRVEAIDLVGATTEEVANAVIWHQGDLFECLDDDRLAGAVVVANLFLHHFHERQLAALGAMLKDAQGLIFCEPERRRQHVWLGRLLWPFVNEVTRHDMEVSIHAGFRSGELLDWLTVGEEEFNIVEESTWRGAYRVVACKR